MSGRKSVVGRGSGVGGGGGSETVVGNYFVSNYPPFSFWGEDGVGDFVGGLGRGPGEGVGLGLYLHIPFCRRRCHFCYFRVYTDKNSVAVNGYLRALVGELELYGGREFVGGRGLDFVYFGGGTPSYLSVGQLRGLVKGLQGVLPWDGVREVTFECEPGTLTRGKLEVIRELGVTRLSLGVENFDDGVLEVNGRAHRSGEIGRAYGWARELGFEQVNVDLIAGMVGETDGNWGRCVERVLELGPDSVTVYQMEVPYNTTIYREMREAGRVGAPVADWETKRRWVGEAFEALEGAGYCVGSAYTAVRSGGGSSFVYRDELWRGADLLGLGVASFGYVGGRHYQNVHDFGPYVEAVSGGRLPVGRALTPSGDERLIREFVLQLKLGRVGVGYFLEKFGVDVRRRFAGALERVGGWGFLEVDGDVIRLSREGLLRVDGLLPEFFLPEHRGARYA